MLKKILGLTLAAALAVCPAASFAEGETEASFPVVQTFNDGVVEGWSAEGGTAEFSDCDYGYLSFTADSAEAVLAKELGIESGAFTVDFKIKAESKEGTAEVSVGGMKLALNLADKTLQGKDFIPSLWYDVRVASDGEKADLYIEGAKVSEDTAITYDGLFSISAGGAMVIGIDDFKVYNEKKSGELTSTPLDFKFDGFFFVNNSADDSAAVEPTITTERTKFDKNETYTSSVQGKAPVFGTNFVNSAGISVVEGKFGKSKDDSSVYINHKGVSAANTYDSTLDFNVGLNGLLPSSGDKQVISFNLAFDGEVPDDIVLRTYNIYQLGSGSNFLGGKAGATTSVTGADGQVMRIVGESMYLFGKTKYYSIRPALLPNQWNNIRLEFESGTAPINSTSATEVAMKVSAYVNDMVVAKDVEVKASEYFVRNQGTDANNRGRFKGIHHLQFNYNWSDGKEAENGLYLDDVKIENLYSGAKYKAVDSPIVWNEKGSLSLDRFAESSEGWTPYRNDKWVQGNIVYVDREMTLQDYKKSLKAERNLGVVFRNEEGETLSDLSRKIGDITYAEITRTDFSKIYVSLIGKTTEITEFTLDGDESSFDTSWDANGVKNNTLGAWDGDGNSSDWGADGGDDNAVTSQNALAGKTDGDKVLKIAAASDGSEKKTKFAFFRKNGDLPTSGTPSVYTKADYFRPMTFEGSVLIPSESSSLNIKTVNMLGSRKSYVYGKGNTQTNHNDALYSLIHFKGGYITARKPYGEDGALELGQYKEGEWNRIAFTVYPGYGRYRIDVAVSGKLAGEYIYISTGGNVMHQATTWLMLNTVGDVYIDDFTATTGYYNHLADNSVKVSISDDNKGVIDVLSDNEFLMLKGKSAEEIKTALAAAENGRIYTDNTYTAAQTGNVVEGNKIVVQNGKILKYFDVNTSDFVIDGNVVKSLARNASDKLCVALYEDGETPEAVQWINAEKKGIVESLEIASDIKSVRTFLWNNVLAPYVPSQTSQLAE